MTMISIFLIFFFLTDPATTEIYTLSLHDALPIFRPVHAPVRPRPGGLPERADQAGRSEEHTSELQSLRQLVCRLLLEKKKSMPNINRQTNKETIYIEQQNVITSMTSEIT